MHAPSVKPQPPATHSRTTVHVNPTENKSNMGHNGKQLPCDRLN